MSTIMQRGWQKLGLSVAFFTLAAQIVSFAPLLGAVVEHFDVLKTKTLEYRNVTVTARSAAEIHITHEGGVQNIKLTELDELTLAALGYKKEVSAKAEMEAKAGETMKALMAKLPPSLTAQIGAAEPGNPETVGEGRESSALDGELQALPQINPQILFAIAGFAVLFYLFHCYCLKLICEKTGKPGGLLVWIPGLQLFPMVKAAGMAPLWVLGFLLPLINIVAVVIWSVRIAQARGKTVLTALLLLLPITNCFALMYLAFSGGAESGGEKRAQPAEPTPTNDGSIQMRGGKFVLSASRSAVG